MLFSCHFYTFTVFLRVIKGIEYHQIKMFLYPPNSMIFSYSPYVKLNIFNHLGTLLYDKQNKPAIAKFCNSIEYAYLLVIIDFMIKLEDA